ncbi:3'-5' exonuclease [Stenotrophomonas sp. SAU14A_NAIMI4_8]|uniref:3'-5' exonuclease n=1 Tax=Stenotrophomonas sp. SAU14A_NAIMI4_8 TaxID=2072409 RepID=UPI000D53C40C|nr:3'-5' exonuclease [Stenotrophomonas sp. SAU14A_NAIMI4_8]AWH31456.1 DNA polymerase III subunit epsilon [Stenotrophomonas sp. SAU14A_NAIMI4_8]
MPEHFISVDVETSGPIPGEFSLLSIGAVVVHQPELSFYVELKPDSPRHDPEAVAVTGLDLDQLRLSGSQPSHAMQGLSDWVASTCVDGQRPVFVGLNAPFDWSFVNYYFHKYCGGNPFGFTALDLKAYFMGVVGVRWDQTKSSQMSSLLGPALRPNHNALDDARYQAELCRLLIVRAGGRS